jgi:Galactose oxidase, central domain
MLRLLTMPTLVGILAVVLAAGCGGGGGSSGPGQPVINGATPPPGMTGVPYAGFAFTVASGGVAPFTWSETGALPAGMSFSPGGQLSGTPATAATYHIMITVADSSTPALTATPVAVSLVIQDSPLVVATAPAPPAGARGNTYPGYTFSVASGGSPGFTWAITAGALPDGLMLAGDGTLSGTPTRNATFQFTATARDSATPAGTGSAPFTIMVNNPPPPTINNTPPPTATVGAVYSPFQFTNSGGLPPFVWGENGSMPGFLLSANGVLSGTPTMAGHFPITVKVTDALSQASPDTPFTIRVSLARPAAAFTLTTGSMKFARFQHSATLMNDGKVLVAGGVVAVGGGPVSTAEVYDPLTGVFADTMGPMTEARAGHTATLLNDGTGKVLIAGGSAMSAAELYNPATGTFAATGSLITARLTTTATLLKSGKVLVVGGNTATSDALAAAELYDPATGKFTATKGNLNSPRSGHTATLLNSGKVLVAGGITGISSPTDTAELYDPATDTFTATTNMTVARTGHTATLLQDGSVLVVGTVGTPIQVTADLYLSTGTFAAVGNLAAAGARTASLRSDGTVVVAGGVVIGETRGPNRFGGCQNLFFPVSVASAELFAPESEGFTATGSLRVPRDEHTATVLADGSVLVVGGLKHTIVGSPAPNNCTGAGAVVALSSAELFK